MTSQQSLWSMIFLLAPAIVVWSSFGFWQSVVAFILTFLIGAILGWTSIKVIPINFIKTWAYIKGPLVGILIVLLFIWYNK